MKLKPEIKVTIEIEGHDKTYRLALIPQPYKGRYWLRYNGKASKKLPECTKTKLLQKIGKLLQLENKVAR